MNSRTNYSNFWFDRQTSLVDDFLADDDVVEEKIQEHDCVIKEGKENNNNDDDDTNNNTLEDEDEIIPIYNTHCVLLNDDTEGEDLVEFEVNSKEEEQVIVVAFIDSYYTFLVI